MDSASWSDESKCWEFFWQGSFLPGQLSTQADSKAASSLHTTERKAVGARYLKTYLPAVEGQRGGGGMGLSLSSTAAENYVKLDAMEKQSFKGKVGN